METSILGTFQSFKDLFTCGFVFFVHDGPIKMAYWTQKRKVKRKGIWETPPIYLMKL